MTSSASTGIGSLPRLSSSHSVSLDGICSRLEIPGDSRSESADVFRGGDGRAVAVGWAAGRSRRARSSCLERGSSACASCPGKRRFRMDRHSSRDWERASRVLMHVSKNLQLVPWQYWVLRAVLTFSKVLRAGDACHRSSASERDSRGTARRVVVHHNVCKVRS